VKKFIRTNLVKNSWFVEAIKGDFRLVRNFALEMPSAIIKFTKVAMLSVIGPKPSNSVFPNDLTLHILSRKILEEDNPEIEFNWFLRSNKDWAVPDSNGVRVRHTEFSSLTIPELQFTHPSLDHGSIMNALIDQVEEEFDFVILLDPDSFVLGKHSLMTLLDYMRKSNIDVAGTPYGMLNPKAFFRDFPTVFFMVFAGNLVISNDLDFKISHQFDSSFRGTMRPNQIQPQSSLTSKIRGKIRGVIRQFVSLFLKLVFVLENPIRWFTKVPFEIV
jgi:hypothetical protein